MTTLQIPRDRKVKTAKRTRRLKRTIRRAGAQSTGCVYLVGAGPGDPELLTVKAQKLIKKADVILFDRLIDQRILKLAKPKCRLINVGKKESDHLLPQDKINALLATEARRHKRIVRLKGGDPFVFGRGSEEALYLKARGVPYCLIPGVSSTIAVPGLAHIPLTHRGVARSFAVITGHHEDSTASHLRWQKIRGIDTLVFVMGVRNRKQIAQSLIKAGYSPKSPVAFIEQGASVYQTSHLTSLGELATHPLPVKSPAIMVVGEVVRLFQ